jgi:uncharacterized membrane protein YfcA
MAALDAMFAYYTRRVTQGHVFRASASAGALVVANSFVILSYVKDVYLIIPAVLGAFAGTLLAMKFETKKKDTTDL